jgi:ferredoxin
LDEWGYPIVKRDAIPAGLEAHAKRAADACPTLALLLERR